MSQEYITIGELTIFVLGLISTAVSGGFLAGLGKAASKDAQSNHHTSGIYSVILIAVPGAVIYFVTSTYLIFSYRPPSGQSTEPTWAGVAIVLSFIFSFLLLFYCFKEGHDAYTMDKSLTDALKETVVRVPKNAYSELQFAFRNLLN